MIPIGAGIGVAEDVDVEALEINRVLGKMSAAQNRVNIVILDMCRDNPYVDAKGVGQNFATMNAPAGTLIAFATGPESRASDAGGDNGLYTGALLKQMNREGVKLEDVFKQGDFVPTSMIFNFSNLSNKSGQTPSNGV